MFDTFIMIMTRSLKLSLKKLLIDKLVGMKKYEIFFLFCISIFTFFIYANALHGEFIMDDYGNINGNFTLIKAFDSLESFKNVIFSNRPVAMLSFALNFYFHKFDTFGYHIVNLAVHLLSGIFLFLFLKKTFLISFQEPDNRNHSLIAMAATAIWLVHPIQTQAVSYMVQRMTSMSAMFYILSMLFYIQARLAQGSWKKKLCFAGCIFSGLLALGSKEIAATLPFFILLYEWYFFQDFNFKWLKKVLFISLAIMIPVALFAVIYLKPLLYSKFFEIGYSRYDFNMVERLLTESRVIIYYLSLILFPHPSRLNLNYDFAISRSVIFPSTTPFAIAFLVLILCAGILLARRNKIWSFAILWYLGNLAIESSFIPLELVYEHRNYLPTMLLFLIPASLLVNFCQAKYLKFISIALVLVLSFWTYERNEYWKTGVGMYEDVVKKSPHSPVALSVYGETLERAGKMDEAIVWLNKSLELQPNNFYTHFALGRVCFDKEQYAEALPHLEISMKNPYSSTKYANCLLLGLCYSELGDTIKANHYFEKAEKIGMSNFSIAEYIARKEMMLGQIDKAFKLIINTLAIYPDNEKLYNLLGTLYLKQGELDKARPNFVRSLTLNDSNFFAYMNLGKYHYFKNEIKAALLNYQKALAISKNDPSALSEIGICYYLSGNIEKAKAFIKSAIDLSFDHTAANHYMKIISEHSKAVQKIDELKHKIDTKSQSSVVNDYYLLGKLYTKQLQYDEAEKAYKTVLKRNPYDFNALNSLALISVVTKNYTRAVEYYLKMVRLYPDNSGIYYNMACIYSKMNSLDKGHLKYMSTSACPPPCICSTL